MTCPSCGAPLPEDGFYGPCSACRAAICSAVAESTQKRLCAVSAAVEAGRVWRSDEQRWEHPGDDTEEP